MKILHDLFLRGFLGNSYRVAAKASARRTPADLICQRLGPPAKPSTPVERAIYWHAVGHA